MTVDMVLNILVVLLLNSTIAILAASNLGYILCHVFALSAVLLMRRDLPGWPRPMRLSKPWLWIAGLLALANLAFALVGAPSFQLTGYGSYKELFVGIGVLVVAVLTYAYRKVVEDREPLRLRDLSPTAPTYIETPTKAIR
jgi:amino acid transporter